MTQTHLSEWRDQGFARPFWHALNAAGVGAAASAPRCAVRVARAGWPTAEPMPRFVALGRDMQARRAAGGLPPGGFPPSA